jgi:hypothetical protein
MEFAHVLTVALGFVIIYVFLTRNKGGVKDLGVSDGKELRRHTTIIMDGIPYRPVSAQSSNVEGMVRITMCEIEEDGRLGDAAPYHLDLNQYDVRKKLAIVSGELVFEVKYDSVLVLLDPVEQQLKDDRMMEFLEGLGYKEIEAQLRDAERSHADTKTTVWVLRKKAIEFIDLLKKQHEKISVLEAKCKRSDAMLEAYGQGPHVINELNTARAEITRLNYELSELRAKETVAMETVQKVLGRHDGGGASEVTVVK